MRKMFIKLTLGLSIAFVCSNSIAKEDVQENVQPEEESLKKETNQKPDQSALEQAVFHDCESFDEFVKQMPTIVSEGVQIDWMDALFSWDLREISVLDLIKFDSEKVYSRLTPNHWLLATCERVRCYGAKGIKREWKGGIPKNIGANITVPVSLADGRNEMIALMHRAICIAIYNVCRRLMKKYAPHKIEKVKIKWVNDVIIDGKKICGIKQDEYVTNPKVCSYSFGVNVNMPQSELDKIDQPATSLSVECGVAFDHNEILKDIIIELISILKKYQHDISSLDAEFSEKMAFVGDEIIVYDAEPGVNVQGILEKVEWGDLFVRESSGVLGIVHPGLGILRKVNP